MDVHPQTSLSDNALHFHDVSERLFTQLTSPVLWAKAGVDFISSASRKAMSTEIAPLAILDMDGVGRGRLGMKTTFCQSNQANLESSDTLSALVQWDSPEWGVVVVKVFTNSPYLLWGSLSSPYLDITTLSAGT